jgi:sterol 3beta-glucosyltransferase
MIRLHSVGSRGDHLSPDWGRIVPRTRTVLPGSVYVLEECPQSWLFRQLRGAIHHGGAGTTATTLCHGLSSTDVACFADQPA